MKRWSLISIVGGLLIAVGSTTKCDAQADKPADGAKLDGAWRMSSYVPPDETEYANLPEGWQETKLVVGGRFVWTLASDGVISRSGGGKVSVRDDQYVEQIEGVSDDGDKWMVGQKGEFKFKLEGDQWSIDGVIKTKAGEAKIKEIWERVK